MTDLQEINFTKGQKWGFVFLLFFISIWTYLPSFYHAERAYVYLNLSTTITVVHYFNLFSGIGSVLIIGKYVYQIGPKLGFLVGLTLFGICYLVNGWLGHVENDDTFLVGDIGRALVTNIVEHVVLIFTYVLIAVGYPGRVATIFGTTIVGLIPLIKIFVGTFVGALINYAWGVVGHSMIVGCMVFLGAILGYFAIPTRVKIPTGISARAQNNYNYTKLIKNPSVWVACLGVFAVSLPSSKSTSWAPTHSFYQVGKGFSATVLTSTMSAILVVITISAPVVGWICDNSLDLRLVGLVGAGSMCLGRALTIPANLGIITIGLLFELFGWTAILVSTFPQALRASINKTSHSSSHGANEIKISGLVSALLISSQKLGIFTGSKISEYLYDTFLSYVTSSLFLLSIYFCVVLAYSFMIFWKKCKPGGRERPESRGVNFSGRFTHNPRNPEMDTMV